MAVFQGARLRNVTLPAQPAVRARTRRISARPLAPARPASGVRPMGVLIATILVVTMVALAYLTQTLGSNATSGEISKLTAAINQSQGLIGAQALAVDYSIDPGRVAKRAADLRLKPLGDPVVLPAP